MKIISRCFLSAAFLFITLLIVAHATGAAIGKRESYNFDVAICMAGGVVTAGKGATAWTQMMKKIFGQVEKKSAADGVNLKVRIKIIMTGGWPEFIEQMRNDDAQIGFMYTTDYALANIRDLDFIEPWIVYSIETDEGRTEINFPYCFFVNKDFKPKAPEVRLAMTFRPEINENGPDGNIGRTNFMLQHILKNFYDIDLMHLDKKRWNQSTYNFKDKKVNELSNYYPETAFLALLKKEVDMVLENQRLYFLLDENIRDRVEVFYCHEELKIPYGFMVVRKRRADGEIKARIEKYILDDVYRDSDSFREFGKIAGIVDIKKYGTEEEKNVQELIMLFNKHKNQPDYSLFFETK